MRVYIYVCVYVYMYICIYVYMYLCIYVFMYLCIQVGANIYIYIYIYICALKSASRKTHDDTCICFLPEPLEDIGRGNI